MEKVDILISTYNGEKYITELLDSILSQSFKDFKIIIRDDCSDDNTVKIINEYINKYPLKICIINNDLVRLKPKNSFEALLKYSNAKYIMFCDQDDYWLPNKIEKTLIKMIEVEKEKPNLPVLICTDLIVVNNHLKILHKSFWNYSKINPKNVRDTYRLAINNPVVGCTVMINNIAKNFVLPFPEKALMHDHWIALKISIYGHIAYLSEPSILYRQHNYNEVGAKETNFKYYLKRIFSIEILKQNIKVLKMLKVLDLNINYFKFFYLKLLISFSKIKL